MTESTFTGCLTPAENSANRDIIELQGCVSKCIIGLLPKERVEKQRLIADLQLILDLDAAGQGELHKSVDYAQAAAELDFICEHSHFRLLESLGTAICAHFLCPPKPQQQRGEIHSVMVALRKPDILAGKAIPGLRICRDANWFRRQQFADSALGPIASVPGSIMLFHNSECRIYRLDLRAEEKWNADANSAALTLFGEFDIEQTAQGPRWHSLGTGQLLIIDRFSNPNTEESP